MVFGTWAERHSLGFATEKVANEQPSALTLHLYWPSPLTAALKAIVISLRLPFCLLCRPTVLILLTWFHPGRVAEIGVRTEAGGTQGVYIYMRWMCSDTSNNTAFFLSAEQVGPHLCLELSPWKNYDRRYVALIEALPSVRIPVWSVKSTFWLKFFTHQEIPQRYARLPISDAEAEMVEVHIWFVSGLLLLHTKPDNDMHIYNSWNKTE